MGTLASVRPVRDGGLCFLEEFEKALDEIRLDSDTDHLAAGCRWSRI